MVTKERDKPTNSMITDFEAVSANQSFIVNPTQKITAISTTVLKS